MAACSMRLLICIVGALAVTGCATSSANGLLAANDAGHIAVVEVSAPDHGAPSAFAAALREVMLREAALYGVTGRPMTLKIELQRVHFKNPVKALIIGDDNQAKGHVTVVDPATGSISGAFDVQVDAERGSGFGLFIAESVIGALDPTGLVDVGTTVGHAASADINRAGTAAAMTSNFSAEALRQTFGDTRFKAVRLAQKQAHAQPPR
jgi:hypothetical protein